MCKRRIILFLVDKILLLLVGILVLLGMVGMLYVLSEYFHLSEEWVMFIGLGCLGYIVLTFYGAFEFTFKKFKMTPISFLSLILIQAVVISSVFFLFYFRVLPLFKFAIPYIIGITILSTCSILILEHLLELLKKRKKRKRI